MSTSVLVSITQQIGVFQDPISLVYGTGSGVDVCGALSYSISSLPATASLPLYFNELYISPASGVITLSPSSNSKVGTYVATVRASLTRYPTVSLSVTFTITVSHCVITDLITSATSPVGNKLYYLSDPTLIWSYSAAILVT